MYLVRSPYLADAFYPSRVWRIKTSEPVIYISFDDGPDPAVTPDALKILNEYDAKACFFCVGEKVKNNQALYQSLLDAGHCTGNHTFNHMNGKETSVKEYLANVEKAAGHIDSRLFRPPYGRIKPAQARALKQDYKIVMWSVLTGDFEKGISPEKVLKRAIRHTRKGSIVVFHDNVKFRDSMLPALRGFLDHFSQQGFKFERLDDAILND